MRSMPKGKPAVEDQARCAPELARIQGAPILYQDRLYVAVASSEPERRRGFGLSVLHLPRKRGCARYRRRPRAVEDLHGERRAAPVPEEQSGVQEFAPAGVPVSSSPTIDSDRRLVYVATGSSLHRHRSAACRCRCRIRPRMTVNCGGQDNRRARRPGATAFLGSPILRTLSSGKQIILGGTKSSGMVYVFSTPITPGRCSGRRRYPR